MSHHEQQLLQYLEQFYAPDEWPTLRCQAEEWAATRPLEGLKLLDATPIFRNTLAKYAALIAAGAELYVPARSNMPRNPEIVAMLPEFGIKTASKEDNFDIILDCAGGCAHLLPSLGFAELTRSGVAAYERTKRPVIVADAGIIKRIETGLGTGDSFFRALAQLGHTDYEDKELIVVGYGKVGQGIVHYAIKHKMNICVVDATDRAAQLPEGVDFIHVTDTKELNHRTAQAWCMVTATGKFNALHNKLEASTVFNNPVLLANMGVDDEYGSKIPRGRVLNNKRPLNFILEEPTRMCFIETTMALHNACALELLTADLPRHCMAPPADVEERLLHIVATQGCAEMQHLQHFIGKPNLAMS